MKKTSIYLVIILISACAISNKTSHNTLSKPLWTTQEPIYTEKYVGIGFAKNNESQTNFKQIAKKKALEKIAIQIDLKFSHKEPFFNFSKEDFKKDFISNSTEYLEDYILEDEYLEDNQYWVYYSLNKEKFKTTRNARIVEAISKAKEKIERNNNKLSLKEKYINLIQSMEIIKPFLNENLITDFDRKKVFLGSLLVSEFRSFISDFRVFSLNKKIKTIIGNDIDTLIFKVEFDNNIAGDVPIKLKSNIFHNKTLFLTTKNTGKTHIKPPSISSFKSTQEIQIFIDFEQWIAEATNDKFIKNIIRKEKTHNITVPIYIYAPNIYIDSKEKDHGILKNYNYLEVLINTLQQTGFNITNKKKEADLFMYLESDSEEMIKESIVQNTGKSIEEKKQEIIQKGFEVSIKNNKLFIKEYYTIFNFKIKVLDKEEMIVYSNKKLISHPKGSSNTKESNNKSYQKMIELIKNELITDFKKTFN